MTGTPTPYSKLLVGFVSPIVTQRAAGTDYFLGDALGSVRQLVDGNGAVTLARSYDPYGNVLSSAGSGATSYDFTGEWRDATGLIFLRARYYSSYQGRFLSRDSWVGSYIRPQSLNSWTYAESDPVNLTDHSGKYACWELSNPRNTDRCYKWIEEALQNMKTHGATGEMVERLFRQKDNELYTLQFKCTSGMALGVYVVFVNGNIGGAAPPNTPLIVLPVSLLNRPSTDPYAVAFFAHEATHVFGSNQFRMSIAGEVYAYNAQSRIFEELGGILSPNDILAQLKDIDITSRLQLEKAREILLGMSSNDLIFGFLPITFDVYYYDPLVPRGWALNP